MRRELVGQHLSKESLYAQAYWRVFLRKKVAYNGRDLTSAIEGLIWEDFMSKFCSILQMSRLVQVAV